MIFRALIFFFTLFQIEAFGQTDSIWNIMILKKGKQPVMKDNMAEYSQTGFYLYRNCFYDLKFKDKTKRTLRLIDIKLDTLIFIGISEKKDTNLWQVAKDTFLVDYKNIDQLLLLKDFGAETSKKIEFEDYFFIFYKSLINNRYESLYAYVFSGNESNSEIVPRLTSYGVTYHFEYGGKLYYHSGIKVRTPKYSDEDKTKTLYTVMTVLDLIVNKHVNIIIQKTNKGKSE